MLKLKKSVFAKTVILAIYLLNIIQVSSLLMLLYYSGRSSYEGYRWLLLIINGALIQPLFLGIILISITGIVLRVSTVFCCFSLALNSILYIGCGLFFNEFGFGLSF